MALTPKMRKFAEAVFNGLSNKEAAISAGYSPETASQQGSKLSKNPEILAYIEKLKSGEKLTSSKQEVKEENFIEVLPPDPENYSERVSGQFVGRDEVAQGSKEDPLEYLKTIWTDERAEVELRIKAAQAAMPYVHGKVGTKGKKETQKDDAKDIAGGGGKFATRSARKRYS